MLGLVLASSLLAAPLADIRFEDPDDLARFDRAHRADRFSIVGDPDDETNHALLIEIPEGDHYGGTLQIRPGEHLDAEPDRLYLRYRLRLGAGWTTELSGKLPGFGGTYDRAGWGGKPSDGHNGWSARGMFAPTTDDGLVPIGSYVYHAGMTERGQTYGSGMIWDAELAPGAWYTIEQEIVLNTIADDAGNADGELRAWIDGELVFERTDLRLRHTDALRVESAWLNVYHGGKPPAPHDLSLMIDDVFVAVERLEPQPSDG